MFRIFDGRKYFYQWDLNQKLIINDNSITEVHFCNRTDDCSLVCEVYTEDGKRLVNVPNALLINDWPIRVFAFAADHTKTEAKYKVISRSKPADYVYTETEVKTFELLEQRMEELENSVTAEGVKEAVEEYLADNPITMDDYYTKEEIEERVATYTETVISPIVADTAMELERLDMKIDRSVPTKVSQLENDSNYLTEEQANGVLEGITTGLSQALNGVLIESKQYTDSVIPKNVSALNNDKGYQTAAEVEATVEEAISNVDFPSGGGAQADWNQNDPDAPDYVKNRPFWTIGTKETVLIEETTAEWTSEGEEGMLAFAPIAINVGETYIVMFDNVRYECVAYSPSDFYLPIIGNSSIMGLGNDGSNGEPFFIATIENNAMVAIGEPGSHTFSVVAVTEETHTIDWKYLPTSVICTISDDGNDCWVADVELKDLHSHWVNGTTIRFKVVEPKGTYSIVNLTEYRFENGHSFICYWGNYDGAGYRLVYSQEELFLEYGGNSMNPSDM